MTKNITTYIAMLAILIVGATMSGCVEVTIHEDSTHTDVPNQITIRPQSPVVVSTPEEYIPVVEYPRTAYFTTYNPDNPNEKLEMWFKLTDYGNGHVIVRLLDEVRRVSIHYTIDYTNSNCVMYTITGDDNVVVQLELEHDGDAYYFYMDETLHGGWE